MREIKFRAWDGKSLSYGGFSVHATGKASIDFPTFNCSEDELVVMQFTGLKDKNGKEIYEGDVLRNEGGEVFEVYVGGYYTKTYCGFGVHYQINGDGSRFAKSANPFGEEKGFEVIGNIYQNPELLNEE